MLTIPLEKTQFNLGDLDNFLAHHTFSSTTDIVHQNKKEYPYPVHNISNQLPNQHRISQIRRDMYLVPINKRKKHKLSFRDQMTNNDLDDVYIVDNWKVYNMRFLDEIQEEAPVQSISQEEKKPSKSCTCNIF